MAIAGSFYAATLTVRPLWTDEFITLITFRRPVYESIWQQQDYAAPLYQLVLRLCTGDGNPPAWMLRGPALVFALLCLPAIWWLARLLFGKRVACYAVPVLAVTPTFFHYAREARPYSLFVLLSIVSMASFVQLLSRARIVHVASYVASTAMLVWTHYYGFLLIAAQLAYAVFDYLSWKRSSASRTPFLLALAGVLILSLPAQLVLNGLLTSGAPALRGGWVHVPELVHFLQWRHLGDLIGISELGPVCVLVIIAALIMGVGEVDADIEDSAVGRSHAWRRRAPCVLCVLWIVFGVLLPALVVSPLIQPVYQLRYGLPALVPMLLLMLAMIDRMPRPVSISAVLILFAAMLPNAAGKAASRPGFPDAVQWIQSTTAPGVTVFVTYWPYCEQFVSPEETALRYYGLRRVVDYVPLKYPYGDGLAAPEVLPTRGRFVVVAFIGSDDVIDHLEKYRYEYKVKAFDDVKVIDVQPVSH